jgi:hypothetical protein
MSSRLRRIRRFASAINGSSENGNLGTRASIDAIIASTSCYVKDTHSGVIPEHWPRRVPAPSPRNLKPVSREHRPDAPPTSIDDDDLADEEVYTFAPGEAESAGTVTLPNGVDLGPNMTVDSECKRREV